MKLRRLGPAAVCAATAVCLAGCGGQAKHRGRVFFINAGTCPAGYGAAGSFPRHRTECVKGFKFDATASTRTVTVTNAAPAGSTTATSTLNCDAGGYNGTLLGSSVCQYDMGSSVVSGPAGAYLDGYFLEATDPCSGITHDAHWSNGEQTQNTVQSYQQQNGECG